MSNSHGPLSIIIPTTFSLPDIISPGKISIPDNNITATPEDTTEEDQPIYEITDPVETISDFISIIDKYDVNKKYNMDVRLLSNIRKELVDLNGMIGMETLKKSVFNQLIYFIQGLHLRKDPDASIHTHGDFKHTVIYGPPGTGKTEVAKIIGRMYANLGVLQKGVFKKVTRNDLVAGYLGQTAIKTTNVINDCLGGVLFIDEAYSLSNSPDLDSFSKECLDTLCEALSNHKEDLMVIIAGYEEELNEHFFKANRGLDSRFVWRFKIDPYNSNELSEIFKKKVSESGWCFETEKTIDTKWFDQFKSSFHHYGRDMEMLFFYTKISHSRRVFGKPATLQRVLTKEDVENGYALFLKNTKQKDNTTRKIFETMYI
jgi:SpoVK/Ycf46/Vps4 family AAA+-type ATPase